ARIDHVLGLAMPVAQAPLMPSMTPADALSLAAMRGAAHTDNCNIESATLSPGAHGEASLAVSGWLSELAASITARDGLIALSGPGGAYVSPIRMDKPRPDVAAFYKNPKAAQSGFAGTFFLRKLPAGAYTAMAYRGAGRGWIACQGKQALTMP
ncbi:MAG TPA: hypothetical protein VGC92_02180, partial [Phenylobacterium sp.]